MELLIILFLTCISLVWGIVPFLMRRNFRNYSKNLESRLSELNIAKWPKVAVIMPCKGTDVGFQDNLELLLKQEYPDWSLHFSVATADDLAIPFLSSIVQRNPQKYHLYIAGLRQGCGQKMNNMVHAVQQVDQDTEILVFLDGDTSLHSKYIQNLVQGLMLENVGASTGYHVFLPEHDTYASRLRSMWAMAGALVLSDQNINFAIGAATAMRKKTFDELQIGNKLLQTLSDTFVFTNEIKKAGLRVEFLPSCFFISRDDSNLKEVTAWSNRLTLLSKVYSFKLWAFVGLSYSLVTFLLATTVLCLIQKQMLWILPSLTLMLSQIIAASLIMDEVLFHLQKNYPQEATSIQKNAYKIAILGPITGIMIMYSTLKSLIYPITTWRGITYKIHSADKIEVLSS